MLGGERFQRHPNRQQLPVGERLQLQRRSPISGRHERLSEVRQRHDLTWQPIFLLSTGTDLKTYSGFINDKWDFNTHFSFNVGLRYDKNDSTDADGTSGLERQRVESASGRGVGHQGRRCSPRHGELGPLRRQDRRRIERALDGAGCRQPGQLPVALRRARDQSRWHPKRPAALAPGSL